MFPSPLPSFLTSLLSCKIVTQYKASKQKEQICDFKTVHWKVGGLTKYNNLRN